MNRKEMEKILRQTLDDLTLSRSERRALSEVIAEMSPRPDELNWIRARAFDFARSELKGHENQQILEWLEDVIKVVARADVTAGNDTVAEAHFTPGSDATSRITSLFRSAERTIDICVFTITDNRLSRAILEAHRRQVSLRIITDDDKSYDRGSDVDRLEAAGIPLRMDHSDAHMHHKFALFDNRILLTGSYNWTRGAAEDNQENFIIVSDPRLLSAYARTFEDLWNRFV